MKKVILFVVLALFFLMPRALSENEKIERFIAVVEPMALGETFAPMPAADLELAAGDLAAAYDFAGRVSNSGRIAYLVGTLRDGATPVNITSDEGGWGESEQGIFIEYPNGGRERLGQFGYQVIDESGDTVFFIMAGYDIGLFHAVHQYMLPGGEARLLDLAARGVSLIEPVNAPHACISMFTNHFPSIPAEYFLLSDEDIAAFKAQEKLDKNENEYGIGYSLGLPDRSDYDYSTPEGLFRMAQEKCGYVYFDEFPKEAPVRAEMEVRDYDGLMIAAQTIEDEASLKKITSLLRSSKKNSGGKCPYVGRLTLTYADGKELVFARATDGCDGIVAGSHMYRSLGKKANEFDRIFAQAMNAAGP